MGYTPPDDAKRAASRKRYEEEQIENRRVTLQFSLTMNIVSALMNVSDVKMMAEHVRHTTKAHPEMPDMAKATEKLILALRDEKDIDALLKKFKVPAGKRSSDNGLLYSALYTLKHSWGFGQPKDPDYCQHGRFRYRRPCERCEIQVNLEDIDKIDLLEGVE